MIQTTLYFTEFLMPRWLHILKNLPWNIRACMCVCAKSLWSCLTLQPYGPAPSVCLWSPPGKNTGVGCHALLQGIFLTKGSNPHLLYIWHNYRFLSTIYQHFIIVKQIFCFLLLLISPRLNWVYENAVCNKIFNKEACIKRTNCCLIYN